MIVKPASNLNKEAWDNYVLSHPDGIAYQLFAWQETVKKAYGFQPLYLMAQSKNQVKGVLPLIYFNIPFKRELISLPYCDAGGPLADDPATETLLLRQALKITSSAKMVIRSTRSFANLSPEKTLSKQKVRMILSLPPASDKLLTSLKAKVRSQVNKADKNGLRSTLGSLNLINDFYSVFSENMRDLGSPVHSIKWIHAVLKCYGNRAHVVVVYMPSGEPAATGIILCHPNIVSIPWASSLRRFNKFNPNMMLYWAFLKYASDNGFPSFDFGRSTIGEGTYNFKKQWGAQPEPLHWAEIISDGNNSELKIKQNNSTSSKYPIREYAENLIKTLPVSLSTALGSSTRKFISL